jgi:hypothetical protein
LKEDNKIPLITGDIYTFLKDSYTGGSCDVYKSYSNNKIYGYDVNSLYPFVMKNCEMPVGIPKYFEGDIFKIDSNPFGFFEVKVTAPEDLHIPLLQTIYKTNNGRRNIAPVGTWIGTYFSEELKEAKKLGYQFEILRGYLFERENIFKDFINDLYQLKANSEKGTADYLIYKLLMNSLYGRFGMSPIKESCVIVDSLTAEAKYHNNDSLKISNVFGIGDNSELISFFNKYQIHDNSNYMNISIPIASAITSYSRIYMSRFKNKYSDNLYYSDTDSIYLDTKLDSQYISDSILGKFKLEKTFDKSLFLSPKMYAGKYLNNDNKYETYAKIKGVKIPISFIELIPLLFKNKHLNIVQEKWIRDMKELSINVKYETNHTLKLSSFKRELVYKNSKFIYTKPLKLNNGLIV